VPETDEYPPDDSETFNLRLPRELLSQLDWCARLERNFLTPIISRFLSEGITHTKCSLSAEGLSSPTRQARAPSRRRDDHDLKRDLTS